MTREGRRKAVIVFTRVLVGAVIGFLAGGLLGELLFGGRPPGVWPLLGTVAGIVAALILYGRPSRSAEKFDEQEGRKG
jgi:uncharacterized protein YcfJ